MKKGTRFLTGLAVACLTFGILMLSLGTEQFNKYGRRHHGHHKHHCVQECQGETK